MPFNTKLINLLKTDLRFLDEEGELVIAAVQDCAWKIDRNLVKLLLSDKEIKDKFFDEVEGHWVFNTNTFINYLAQKNFLDNSYTRFRNRIGMTIGNKYLRERGDVALVWPYKDTILEGGQTREEEKRKEIFFNEVLAQDEISRLLDPKVLTNFTRYTAKGKEPVKDLERNIVQSAIARNPFFTFASLSRYFTHIASMQEFITSDNYLGGLEITFQGALYLLEENKTEKLAAMIGLLNRIEAEIRQQITDYQGSKEFERDWVHERFTDKILKFSKDNVRGKDDTQFEQFVSGKDWFAFNTIYGTSEEKAFVRMLDRQMGKLSERYDEIYLVRNEGHFKIYSFSDGQAFEPDFVLFLREKNGTLLTYQLFIEPKGKYLKEYDHWKEAFLKEITVEFGSKILKFEDKSKYRLIGIPFYNNEDENIFRANLESVLSS